MLLHLSPESLRHDKIKSEISKTNKRGSKFVYTDLFGVTFIKRCALGTYALNRTYRIVPEDCWIGGLTCDSAQTVHLTYMPRSRMRKKQETFRIADYSVRSIRAGGIQLSSKELADCRLE